MSNVVEAARQLSTSAAMWRLRAAKEPPGSRRKAQCEENARSADRKIRRLFRAR